MNVLIAGGSGFIGREISSYFVSKGISVSILTRNKNKALKVFSSYYFGGKIACYNWAPSANQIEEQALKREYNAVICLSGESIFGIRWTLNKKERIKKSRVDSVKTLVNFYNQGRLRGDNFIFISAVGFYGDTKGRVAKESSPNGSGFLAETAKLWEDESLPLEGSEARRVILRLPVVLGAGGGMLEKLAPLAKLGLASPLGSGDQILSWISLEDLSRVVLFLMLNKDIKGVVNGVSPSLITNYKLVEELSRLYGKKPFVNIPQFALRIIFGEMAKELMLAESAVEPKVLTENKFAWLFNDLRDYLNFIKPYL